MDGVASSTSINGIILFSLQYAHHRVGSIQRAFSQLSFSDFWSLYTKMVSSSYSRIFDSQTRILESIISGASKKYLGNVVEFKYLSCASYALMGFSIFCIFLLLRRLSVSYPDIEEVNTMRTIDNLETYKFANRTRPNQSAFHTVSTGREDIRDFAASKTKDIQSPGVIRRQDSWQHSQNSRISDISPMGISEYYMNGEEHSMISDDGASELSRNGPYDHNDDSVIRGSAVNPSMLIGWQINVKGRGMGLILDMKKSFGRTTKFKVQFESGEVKMLSLKRSDKKGDVPFSLIMKAN